MRPNEDRKCPSCGGTDQDAAEHTQDCDLADALRYRWLLKNYRVNLNISLHGSGCQIRSAEEVTAAIDARMAASTSTSESKESK